MNKTTNLEVKHPEFATRIKHAMKMANYSMAELARCSGISYEMIRRYTEGYAMPKVEGLSLLAKSLGVTPAWLQFGEELDLKILPIGSSIGVLEEYLDFKKYIEIKRFDVNLSAGAGNSIWIARESSDDPIVFRRRWFKRHRYNPDLLKGIYVRGDSMEPELHNGDTVIINTNDTEILDGEIYAIVFKNKLYIKKLCQSEDGILIISKNPEYPPMKVTEDTLNQFIVLGKKIWRGG